jgi:glycosyltransferase involved in cell wall biosynthesis
MTADLEHQRALPMVALEIGPLGEHAHTGIGNVTKRLTIELLNDRTVDGRFFFGRQMIPRSLVEKVVTLHGFPLLSWIIGRCDFDQQLEYIENRPLIAIYTNHKWYRRLFPFEVIIIHDLTTTVTPQYQVASTVEFWESRLAADMATSDLIVCCSASTEQDVRTYYPQLHYIPSIVSLLAPSSSRTQPKSLSAWREQKCEPYVLVLGTLEPRKNVGFVLDFLSNNRNVFAEAKFVFAGRWGWGDTIDELIKRYGLEAEVSRGLIRFTGFVSDDVRDALIEGALGVIYPSRYEGFGLPIVEAFQFGSPVVTTLSSSLPEAAGELAYYFDMDSPPSFGTALTRLLRERDSEGSENTKEARRKWVEPLTWSATYERIRDAALQIWSDRYGGE